MKRIKTRRPRTNLKKTLIKCFCEKENEVVFPKPEIMHSVKVRMECAECKSLWLLTFKNSLKCKKGHFEIGAKAISLTPKLVEAMKSASLTKALTAQATEKIKETENVEQFAGPSICD
jgi:hypothetical protein